MPVLSPEAVLTPNPALSWRVLEGEAVILHPRQGTLHRLNPTGTRVWERLDGHATLGAIAAALTAEYEVGEEEAARDLAALAGELVDAGLVKVGG